MHPRPRSLAVAAILTTVLVTAACGQAGSAEGPAGEQSTLAVIAAGRANMPRIAPAAYAEQIAPYLVEGVHVSVVTEEGTPQILGADLLSELASNPTTREEQLVGFRDSVLTAIAGATSKSAEADPLLAVGEALRAAGGTGRDEGPCTVVIGSSLLQSTGAIPVQDLLGAEVGDVVEALRDGGQLPDLGGCAVVSLGVGLTQAPQEPLAEADQGRLERLWEAVFTEAGATSVTFVPRPVSEPVTGELPPVTPVTFTPEPVVVETEAATCRIELPDAVLNFAPETADFLDPAASGAVIDDVAAQLAECPGTVRVVGTTSSAGTEEGRARVSTARAEAVRDLLAGALGVSPGTISAKGLGHDTSAEGGAVADRVDGRLDPVLAAQNRRTTIFVEPGGA
jgi:outer membrane protein OmpA-like peptidoglycan-associated protein